MSESSTLSRELVAELVRAGVKDALDDENDSLEITEETRLLGQGTGLDSLGLVTLIVDLEQQLDDDYDIDIVLASEKAMSQKNSPFRSVGTLTDYIWKLAQEES